jgi:hypothetical protein
MAKMIILLLISISVLVGCEPIRKAKMYTRHFILGKPLEAEPTPTPIPEEVKDFKKEAEVIVQITPQKRVYNLINGYLTTPETAMKNLLVSEFSRADVTFKTDDPELISSLTKFAPLVQDNNSEAMEIMISAYIHLRGANQEAAANVVALGFDYMLPKTIELYHTKKKDNNCYFASNIDKNFDLDQKLSIYKTRRETMAEYQSNAAYPENFKAFVSECDKAIQIEQFKMNSNKKIQVQEVVPEATETPDQSPIAIPPSQGDFSN